ncbi:MULTISPECIES: hypothetical protein [unclassified Microbacterium]|uniref:hypothetical protein n=1 Tax=unclassified Microbacterium TaxID=2609290 RepID=UPI0025CBFA56|nr:MULTISPECIES: hypothetical protein [unclassified Microbacterium]
MSTIPSAQLAAITRLEFASDALTKALRAVQHPALEFAGGAIVAPPGIKHLGQIRSTLQAIECTLRQSDPTTYGDKPDSPPETAPDSSPSTESLGLTAVGIRLLDGVIVSLAADLRNAMTRARAQLRLLPELQGDPERLSQVLRSALRDGSRLGRRIFEALNSDDNADA